MKKVTLADIAREAGVSKATVSRVLSRPDLVKPETLEKVATLIEKYAFVPSALARGLAGTATRNIGVIIDELSNNFFIEIAEGIDGVLSSAGYSMQLSSSRWILEKEISNVRHLLGNRVDGILLAPVFPESPSIRLLKESGVPFLVMNCIPEDPDISYVSCDNRMGGRLAAEYINSLNREQTIVITGYPHQSLKDRFEGFAENFRPVNGREFIHYSSIKTFEDGYEMVPVLISRNRLRDLSTTLFITNDNVAMGITTRLIELGIPVPHQVSVVGYDDIRLSSLCRIPLTTVSQSIRNIGKIAAMELLEFIQTTETSVKKTLVEPSLILRNSSCPAP